MINVKLKKNAKRRWKNWDGHKVWTVSIDDVRWVQCEHWHWPEPPRNAAPRFKFKLKPKTFTTVNCPLTATYNTKIGKIKATQISVNSNLATTGHKLQGMSKGSLIVNNWNYQCTNWIRCTVPSTYQKRLVLD
jgi:hypothetical protein